MTCHRCEGFMVQDDYFQLVESERRLAAWRCVLCGDVVDPVIVANRKQQLAGAESSADSHEQGSPLRPLTIAA
ncbi:MAG: hypothetical protein ACRD2L_22790 [Terriglobia bacterium]